MPKQVSSMQEAFESINEHDDLLKQDVLPRLKEVERLQETFTKVQEDFTKEITSIRHAQSSLELTVMKESQTNRQQIDKLEGTLTAQSDDLFEIVRSALGMKAKTDDQQHEFRMAKWNTVSSIFLKISGALVAALGSGGIIYLAFQKFIVEK